MHTLPRVSIIICTRNRPKDLAELLSNILYQTYLPTEVIIIDDTLTDATKKVINYFNSKFNSITCKLKYIKGTDDGLPASRNLGVKASEGDLILFLDDDVLLENSVLYTFAIFFTQQKDALGVQGQRYEPYYKLINSTKQKIEFAIRKILMLSYHEQNTLAVRRSGASIFPYLYPLRVKNHAQRLDGFCMCYRRNVFNMWSFDTNLKRWGSMEDLDFSFRIYKENPHSLYVIPQAKIVHKKAEKGMLPKLNIYMSVIYWFYVFFKNIFENSILNLIAFVWALTGNLVVTTGGLIIKRKQKRDWWGLIYLVGSYTTALKNLKNIRMGKLEFFNKNL